MISELVNYLAQLTRSTGTEPCKLSGTELMRRTATPVYSRTGRAISMPTLNSGNSVMNSSEGKSKEGLALHETQRTTGYWMRSESTAWRDLEPRAGHVTDI